MDFIGIDGHLKLSSKGGKMLRRLTPEMRKHIITGKFERGKILEGESNGNVTMKFGGLYEDISEIDKSLCKVSVKHPELTGELEIQYISLNPYTETYRFGKGKMFKIEKDKTETEMRVDTFGIGKGVVEILSTKIS